MVKSTLLQIARLGNGNGFRSLKERSFRNKILEFFIPTRCVVQKQLFIGDREGQQINVAVAATTSCTAAARDVLPALEEVVVGQALEEVVKGCAPS